MEKGDIIAVAGGLVIVCVIALAAHPEYIAGLQDVFPGRTPSPTPATPFPTPVPPTSFPVTVTTVLPKTSTPLPTPVPPYRIYYTDNPFSYPSVRLPDDPGQYGESEIRRAGEEAVTFAYLADSRGGLTRIFSIPYPIWAMDINVIDNATPNVASFRMALCYASNGTVIDAVELIHPGTSYVKVQTSNTPLYLIISTSNIDGFRISFETSREYYEKYGAEPSAVPAS